MRVDVRWAIVLLGATALAGPASAQTSAPPIKRQISVAAAPERPVPDAEESDAAMPGPEALAAMAGPNVTPAAPPAVAPPSEVAQIMAGTLNAQYAAAWPAPVQAPTAAPPSPVVAEAASFAASAPVVMPVVAPIAPPAPAAAAAPPSGPSVALARRLVESAEAFADYMGRASALRPDYVDTAGVSRAVDAGGAYEPGQLEEGAIAYVALVALQDPEFVRTVDALGREGYRERLASALAADPRAVMQMPTSAVAAARAAHALGRMGSALMASGAAVKQSAYDMQHSPWSRAPVASPTALLADLKTRSALREVLAQDNGQAMLATLVQLRGQEEQGGSGRLTPAVARGLTLAALAVLGEAGEEHADRVAALLNDGVSGECLKMARLNLYQCLSVAGPSYEDAFCLGQHALMDTAQCVETASGWSAPAQGVAVPVAMGMNQAVPSRPASVMVPVALGAGEAPVDPQVPPPATLSLAMGGAGAR